MPTPGIYEDTGTATAEAGLVMLDGPDGIAITLTPEAAEGTGQALIRAAQEARAQFSDVNASDAQSQQAEQDSDR